MDMPKPSFEPTPEQKEILSKVNVTELISISFDLNVVEWNIVIGMFAATGDKLGIGQYFSQQISNTILKHLGIIVDDEPVQATELFGGYL